MGEAGGQSYAVVAPSCGENVTLQEAGQDSLQGGGEGADRDQQRGGP